MGKLQPGRDKHGVFSQGGFPHQFNSSFAPWPRVSFKDTILVNTSLSGVELKSKQEISPVRRIGIYLLRLHLQEPARPGH